MIQRRAFMMASAGLLLGMSTAMAMEPYSKASFDQMLASGQPMIVHVHATWCPVCKAQEPTLAALANDPETRGAKQIRVDFDKDKAFLAQFNVPSQSVILVFKGGKETGRVAGQSQMAAVKPALVTALR
jgi:thioredoxin 1